jgi:hypothetical protein
MTEDAKELLTRIGGFIGWCRFVCILVSRLGIDTFGSP